MKFSIITCTRNNEKWIKKNIDSVKNQTYQNYEHIIIDDASTDNSIAILQQNLNSTNMKVFVRKDRAYAVKNHLLGMKNCTGDVIVHLDGDDWFYDENVLSYLHEQYTTTNCLATYGSWVHFDTNQNWRMPPFIGSCAEDIRNKRIWSFTHLRSFKKELLSTIPAMDLVDEFGELYKYAYDVVLLTGIYEYAMKKNKLLYIDKPMVVYNSNTGNNDHTVALDQQSITAAKVFISPYSVLKLL